MVNVIDAIKLNSKTKANCFLLLFCSISFTVKVWNGDAKILAIVGEDDQCLEPSIHQRLLDRMPANKKTNMEIVKYPGAGHIIEPPYSPLYKASYSIVVCTLCIHICKSSRISDTSSLGLRGCFSHCVVPGSSPASGKDCFKQTLF